MCVCAWVCVCVCVFLIYVGNRLPVRVSTHTRVPQVYSMRKWTVTTGVKTNNKKAEGSSTD